MTKVQRNFRLDSNVDNMLDDLVRLFNSRFEDMPIKGITKTDMLQKLIKDEVKRLREDGYNI